MLWIGYLQNIGHCSLCNSELPPLADGLIDDRLFCGGTCALLALAGNGDESLESYFICQGCGRAKRRTQTEIDRDSGELIREDALCGDCVSREADEITPEQLLKLEVRGSYKH
jgi:hypothetical protein